MINYIVFDCESVPDGKLINMVKYPDSPFDDEESIEAYKQEILEGSQGKTDFISPIFQFPVAVSLAKIDENYLIDDIVMLDSPEFRPQFITESFWKGLNHYKVPIVSFNGRGFDIPLLEASAFRYGISASHNFNEKYGLRYRFGEKHIDLMDWITNYGAVRKGYSLDLLSKLLGKPGKMTTKGSDVYSMYRQGKIKEINEYCSFDVLDTYFIFLRSLVLKGQISIKEEQKIVGFAKEWLQNNLKRYPFLKQYLDNWGDWTPWP
ncbi:MAG: 3'-5' exonuclease [Candidatus Aureabacteria bacterium]|nr:3'-5' exonuclease [Candidatus Auribacterota bacterium]